MAWKPRLLPASTEVVPMEKRPWVAVAEKHAEEAVNLFVNIMKNPKLPVKMRMEAATRIVMIAGATFRGEKRDGNGRPAANLPSGTNVSRLRPDALRSALAQLPPGSVLESPEELARGEVAVVFADSDHTRRPTGKISQTTQGATVIGEADPEEAKRLIQERLAEEAEEEARKPPKKEPAPVTDAAKLIGKLFKQSEKKTRLPDDIARLNDRLSSRLVPSKRDNQGARAGGSQAGQVEKLADSSSLDDSPKHSGEDA